MARNAEAREEEWLRSRLAKSPGRDVPMQRRTLCNGDTDRESRSGPPYFYELFYNTWGPRHANIISP